MSKIKQFKHRSSQSLDFHEEDQHKKVLLFVFPGKSTETVSLQHLFLLIVCPMINTLPDCPACSLCDTVGKGTAALMATGEK